MLQIVVGNIVEFVLPWVKAKVVRLFKSRHVEHALPPLRTAMLMEPYSTHEDYLELVGPNSV